MPFTNMPQMSALADEFDQLVKKYREFLPQIYTNLTAEELEEMASDAATMQMRMEGKFPWAS